MNERKNGILRRNAHYSGWSKPETLNNNTEEGIN